MNTLHYYVGLPILAAVAINGIMRRKTNNKLSNRLTLAALFASLALASYGIPPLITANSTLLTLGYLFGDISMYIGIYFVWLGMIRVYIVNSVVWKNIAKLITSVLLIAIIGVSIYVNTTNKVWLEIKDSSTSIHYGYPHYYQFLNSIDFIALILLGINFLKNASAVQSSIQKWRLIAYGVLLTGLGVTDFITPFMSSKIYADLRIAGFILSFSFLGIFLISSKFVTKKKA